MKYVTATLGALFIFGGAFIALMFLPGLIFPHIYKSIAGLIALYAIGVPLAITAAVLSFRATLRQYAPKAASETERIRCPGCGETIPASAKQCPLCGRGLSQKN